MRKRSTPSPAPVPAPARRRRALAQLTPEEVAGDSPRRMWDPDRTDIERPNELQGLSIETESRDENAGGVEAPESLTEVKKATPFE